MTIQKILPVWAVILLMMVVLSFTAYKTFIKGFSVYAKEKEKLEAMARASRESAAKMARGNNKYNIMSALLLKATEICQIAIIILTFVKIVLLTNK